MYSIRLSFQAEAFTVGFYLLRAARGREEVLTRPLLLPNILIFKFRVIFSILKVK